MKVQVGQGKGQKSIEFVDFPVGNRGVVTLRIDGVGEKTVTYERDDHGLWLHYDGQRFGWDIVRSRSDQALNIDLSTRGPLALGEGMDFRRVVVLRGGEAQANAAGGASGRSGVQRIKSEMPGKVVRVHVKAGAIVKEGDPLLVLEAMKMENEIRAQRAGRVTHVGVESGQAVESGAELLRLEALS